MKRDNLKNKKGFSLVEMLIVISLLSIVIALAYMFFFTGVNAFRRNAQAVDVQQNVRHSVAFITRRLLNAPSRDGVSTANGQLQIGNEAFRLQGTTLQVNHNISTTTWNPLAEGITTFTFSKEGNFVNVSVIGDDFSLSSRVFLRR